MKDSTTIGIGVLITIALAIGVSAFGHSPWPVLLIGWILLGVGNLVAHREEVES